MSYQWSSVPGRRRPSADGGRKFARAVTSYNLGSALPAARSGYLGARGRRGYLEEPARTFLRPRVSQTPDQLETVLSDYERRKQEETRRMVQRAFKLENARKKGAEHLRQFTLPHSREVADRLQQAGHRVVYQEFLDAYPPNVRLHLYPKQGPMDLEEPRRRTIEFVWGEPDPDRLFVKTWSDSGLGDLQELASVPSYDVDELWVREQLLAFVREALDLS